MSSRNILHSAFLLITVVSCYGQHCCKPINIHVTLQKQDFLFSYPFFPPSGSGTKKNRRRGYGVAHVFNDRGKTTFSSLFYCCNFYGSFKWLLAEIHFSSYMPFMWYLNAVLDFTLLVNKVLFLGHLETHSYCMKIEYIIWNFKFRRTDSMSVFLVHQKGSWLISLNLQYAWLG